MRRRDPGRLALWGPAEFRPHSGIRLPNTVLEGNLPAGLMATGLARGEPASRSPPTHHVGRLGPKNGQRHEAGLELHCD